MTKALHRAGLSLWARGELGSVRERGCHVTSARIGTHVWHQWGPARSNRPAPARPVRLHAMAGVVAIIEVVAARNSYRLLRADRAAPRRRGNPGARTGALRPRAGAGGRPARAVSAGSVRRCAASPA